MERDTSRRDAAGNLLDAMRTRALSLEEVKRGYTTLAIAQTGSFAEASTATT